jgi:hypothetical protein
MRLNADLKVFTTGAKLPQLRAAFQQTHCGISAARAYFFGRPAPADSGELLGNGPRARRPGSGLADREGKAESYL